jgi:hypothetical protein
LTVARFLIVCGFTTRGARGRPYFISPAGREDKVLDTSDDRWDLPNPFVPPVTGLEPLDQAAKEALDLVRMPYGGQQLPGVGTVPLDTPIITL